MAVRRWILGPILGLAVLPTFARAEESANWQRLRSMPRERRVALSERLQQFDTFGRDEQSAIRELDAKIAALPESEQARYRAVLRRYHNWVESLSDEQREQLKRARPGTERMTLVTKLRSAEKSGSAPRRTTPLTVQLMPGTALPPVELARSLRVWFELPAAERARLDALPPLQFFNGIRPFARQHLVKWKPFAMFPNSDEDALIQNLEADLAQAGEVPVPFKLQLDLAKVRKGQEQEKGGTPEKALQKAVRYRQHLAEDYYFIKHPPEKVSAENLSRFQAGLPGFVRLSFDPLPTEEVRRRLTVLYRLVYPFPEEMPRPQPAASKAAAKAPQTKKAPGPPATAKPAAPAKKKSAAPSSSTTPF